MQRMDIDDYPNFELRRPDLILRQVADQNPFDRPRTLLARVDGRYAQQRLVGVTVLWDAPAADERERSTITEKALARLGFEWTRANFRDWPLAVPVVVRPGSAWPCWDEDEALLGLRYGSNCVDCRHGDVLTVTGRGWYSSLDGIWGTSPRAHWSHHCAS